MRADGEAWHMHSEKRDVYESLNISKRCNSTNQTCRHCCFGVGGRVSCKGQLPLSLFCGACNHYYA